MGTTRVAPRPPYAAAAIGGGTLLLLALATTAGDSPISPCAAADHHATELLVEIIHDDPHRAAIYGPQLGQAVDRLATARRYCAYGWTSEGLELFGDLIGALRRYHMAASWTGE